MTDYNRGTYGSGYGSSGYGSGYGSSGYSSGGYGSGNYGRGEFGRQGRDDRGWWDRTTDEVSSWFGDEDAERRRRMDRMQERQHKGRGPKNYQRSDDRIKEDINDRLSDDWFVDASDIDVTVQNGEVTLSGHVDERTAKRRAEDIAEAVSGVKHVENRLRVTSSSSTSSSSYTGSGSSTESSMGSGSTLGSSTSSSGIGTSRTKNSINENK
jgi:osmotically-inducible protein OsmY